MLIWMIWLTSCTILVQALRDGGEHPLVVDYSEHYYYKSIRAKMIESLSVNNCSVGGDVKYGNIMGKDGPADLTVKVIPPPQLVRDKWSMKNEYRAKNRIFAHVSDNLCASSRYKDVVKGFYKRAKGCYKVYAEDKNGQRYKRFNDYGATLHPEHIRCENQLAKSICNAGSTGLQVVEDEMRNLNSYPFILHAEKVIVGRGGMFALPCGPVGLFSSCEAVKCGIPEADKVVPFVEQCRDPNQECPYPKYDRVFVMTQYDDTQIGQYMQEAFPKFIYHLDYLQKHPEVKIHFGFTKQPKLPNFVLPHNFFDYFGMVDRLINGTVYANEVIMPREGGCQDIGYNAWEAVTMREHFYNMLDIKENVRFERKKPYTPTVLVLTRSAGSFTQNKADYATRRWKPKDIPVLLSSLKQEFPNHAIEIFSDTNSTLMTCPLCQAERFSRADIVVGYHGAGLSNAVFMKPGGVMVEVIYHFDSRHAPIIGIFPRISDIIGLHHFSYYVRDIEFNVTQFVKEVGSFTRKSKLWTEK